ncbi:male-specific lethal 3 homolog isoform X2 [Limulus polyphemus]|uniref:Male-specific lethal 3 homolog isoform X2 n=1 Tax=Limulus polyphemus TaxID=6850 RepID=A0ABM1BRG0_LIMPO|nr:male-specific lethal 3 homolog isoform X2 [Limulus polyphemus]
MVSTRGVKFKFSEGEKVLCYEPDPTKAKVLYESKVLELVVNRDTRGRKVPEYLVHFSGWNSSWDRCVSEDYICPDTEDNRKLQKQLAEEAAEKLKGSRRKLPPVIKETLNKKLCKETEKENKNELAKRLEESSTESESSELVRLPSEPNVVSLLEAYAKSVAVNTVCSSPPKNSKNHSQSQHLSADSRIRIELCREVVDGFRVFFDFTLPSLLLYRSEKSQYSSVRNFQVPAHPLTSVTHNSDSVEIITKEHREVSTQQIPSCNGTSRKTSSAASVLHLPTSLSGRRSCNARYSASSEHLSTSEPVKSHLHMRRDSQGLSDSASNSSPPRRLLRSSGPTVQNQLKSNNKETSDSESCHPTSATVHHNLRAISLAFQGVHSSTTSSSVPHVNTSQLSSLAQRTQPPPPLSLTSVHVASASSSASSTYSGPSTPPLNNSALCLRESSQVLDEVLTWQLVPESVYRKIPPPPSVVYGAHHLLRMFVKLPELLHKMSLSHRKLNPVLQHIHGLLQYLTERHEELFPSSFYIVTEDESIGSST